jgi:hypothetical protein
LCSFFNFFIIPLFIRLSGFSNNLKSFCHKKMIFTSTSYNSI